MKDPVRRIKQFDKTLFYTGSYAIDSMIAKTNNLPPPILITGFWRSGTTWVQEVVSRATKGKTIFEPFSSKANFPFNPYPVNENFITEARMPASFSVFSKEDLILLDKAFKGVCFKQFSFYCRKSILDAFKKQVVIKFVRAPFIADKLISRYKPKAIHISRNPLAIINSFEERPWMWSFADVDLKMVLLGADNNEGLLKDKKQLEKFETADIHEKLAAYWAICEKNIHKIPNSLLYKAKYEDLVIGGNNAFKELFINLTIEQKSSFNIKQDSVVTLKGRSGLSTEKRLNSWKETMDTNKQKKCLEIIQDIWPEYSQKNYN